MTQVLLGLLLAAAVQAKQVPENWRPHYQDKWGGLNLLQDSTMLGPDAQVATNVLTDAGYLEKRPGNVRLATVLAGFPVQYVADWAAPNGNRYLIAQASQTIYQTNFSTSMVALSTIAAGYNVTTVPAFSRLEFADGFRSLWYWNGTSTATVTDPNTGAVAPVCTYIAFKDNRIWCGNLPNGFTTAGSNANGGGSSTIFISSAGGDGYWAVPVDVAQLDQAPNRFDFNPDDGDQITCLATTPWGVFVGKRYSSYLVKGNGNLSYDPRILDPKIGCVDNRSVQMVYGVLVWLAVDGVYGYDGTGPPILLTRELDPLMALVREASFSQGQWATQLQPDWASGTTSTTTGNVPAQSWDFSSVPGEIFPSSGTFYDDNRSPELQGGVGFSSDTLVNIDTTTYPLNTGGVQMAPSSAGVIAWQSTFPSASYTTGATTWTAHVNASIVAPSSLLGEWPASGIAGAAVVGNGNLLYTAKASGSVAPSNGWLYGAWTFLWAPGGNSGGDSYGFCAQAANQPCVELDFIADRPALESGSAATTAWNGYGVQIVQTNTAGGLGSTLTYNVNLFKSVAGTKTTLTSASFTQTQTANFVGLSTFTVTRTPGGYFQVLRNGSVVAQAYDSSASITQSVVSNLIFFFYQTGGAFSASMVSSVTLSGYSSGSVTTRIVDIGIEAPLAGALSSSYTLQGVSGETSLDFFVRSSTSPNNDMWTSWQASSNGVVNTILKRRYWQGLANFYTHTSSYTPVLDSLQIIAISTGYYYSPVNFVGTLITSWRQFGVTEANPGTYNYWVRQATYSFAASDTSISWSTQAANQNVNLSVSTPTYAQFRLDSTNLTDADDAESITGVFLRWNQGANLPVASATLERRYLICVAISTTATAPDTCLIRQKNGKWVTWDNGSTVGAMGLYNNQIVAADGGTSSKVWQIMQPGIYQDDGEPISAEWVSQDYNGGLPFNYKTLHEMWVDATAVSASSVTVSYQYDKLSGFTDYEFSLDSGLGINTQQQNPYVQYGETNKYIPLSAGYQAGKYFRVGFSDATLNSYFRIISYLIFLEDQGHQIPN